jgi:hypothetical protein
MSGKTINYLYGNMAQKKKKKKVNFICGNLKSVFHYFVEEETLA